MARSVPSGKGGVMGVPRTRWTPRPVIGSLRPGSASSGEGISDGLRKSTTTERIAYVTLKKRRAVGYVRVSRVGGRSGDSFLSPDLQREQIEGVARREGLTIVEVINELDASGGDADRPEWNRALDMVESGEVDGIVVWNLTRFSRSVKEALTALDRVESAGGQLWSATETLGDDPAGRMMRTVLLAVAENERDRAKATFRDSASSAIERGVSIHGLHAMGATRVSEGSSASI